MRRPDLTRQRSPLSTASNPNGSWSLYVFDDSGGDIGAISNGWSLTLSSITPVNQLADLGLTAVAAPSPGLWAGL